MKRFIAQHADKIIGVLSGFDRLLFRGTLRGLAYDAGMQKFLNVIRVLRKDYGDFVEKSTQRLKEASLREAHEANRPMIYLPSSQIRKEDEARQIAKRDGIREGLVCVLSCVEPCRSYQIFRNRETRRTEVRSRLTKCLHLYHYRIDPVFGFMHARLQTWFPFNIQICLNGREWLARAMDREGIRYERRENTFSWIDKLRAAQRLLRKQVETVWERELDRIAAIANPACREILGVFRASYYWSLYQSEWATDLMFRDAATLAGIYRPLVLYGITTFSSADVMRFLGGKVHGNFAGEIVSDYKDRPEGIRIRHQVGHNSVKLYDKQGSVLRVETTINQPRTLKVYRRKEGDPRGKKALRSLRQGVADLPRRAKISQDTNERYLDALAAVDTTTRLGDLLRGISAPVRWKGDRIRGLRPWAADDLNLFRAVSRGEFCLNGFCNRDLRNILFPDQIPTLVQAKRNGSHVTRLIRILRAHRLIRKVPSSHRYRLTQKGRDIFTAVLMAEQVTPSQLRKAAA